MSEIASMTVLTPADVANQLQSKGLDALGLTMPALSPVWSSQAATADDTTLRLSLNAPRAPFTGSYRIVGAPVTFASLSGDPITAAAGVLSMHPEAVHRLETLVRIRYGALQRPLPVAMLVHGVTVPAQPAAMSWFRGGEDMGITGAHDVSFHDRRGLIIDPVAVASMFADLLLWRPGLGGSASGSTIGPGSVGSIGSIGWPASAATAADGSGRLVRVHVVSPHGATSSPVRATGTLQVIDSSGVLKRQVPASGLVDLAEGEMLGRATADAATDAAAGDPLLWGLAPGGTLQAGSLATPALPTGGSGPSPKREFFRVVAVDLDWHLLGNRDLSNAPRIPGETGRPPEAPLPPIRKSSVDFDFLIDGNDVLGAMGATAAALPAGAADQRALLCSPSIETGVPLPPTAGAGGHWPRFPGGPIATDADATAVRNYSADGAGGPTATWRVPASGMPRDVIVAFQAGALPVGTHVRVFPRTFKLLRGIGEDPSFVRGDGGSAIVAAPGAKVLLTNPFQLDATEPVPASPAVTVDIVAVARDGTRRLLSAVELEVGPAQPWTDNSAEFGGSLPPLVSTLLAVNGSTSISPATTFGNPQVPPPPGLPALPANPTGSDVAAWGRALANETTSPRIGPHLPTQARFDTILAVGSAATTGQPYVWNAVLTGARFAIESRCAQPDLGDPGNPAGVDAHITGVRVGGQLAYDLAYHALRRCLPIIPLGGPQGWIVQTGGNSWNVPAEDPEPPAGQPFMAGAVLETIAPFVDSPELSFLPLPSDTTSVNSLVTQVATALNVTAPAALTLANEPRLRRQLQGEIQTAADGQRDAMWSIARAAAEAREYVLVESPMFGRTARPDATHTEDGLVDLVTVLKDRVSDNPRLKVLVCVPRYPDFPVEQHDWFRAALAERKAALELLVSADSNRVVAFHPIGFPGRSTVGRGTVVLVDDVYALVGTSHWRRRGMTFDGGCDLVSIDRRLNNAGTSTAVARFRQELLATRLGVPVPSGPATSSALWTRLAEPESAFDAVRDLLQGGGLGRCTPVWAGPTDTSVLPETEDKTDPNGRVGPALLTTLSGLIP